MYLLDEVAAEIWALVDGARTTAEIADALVEEFEVTRERAANDVDALLAHLAAIGALEQEKV